MGQKSSKSAEHIDSRFLAPQKLYCYNEVDLKKLRRLIKDRKIAPCFYGVDTDTQECAEVKRVAFGIWLHGLRHKDETLVGRSLTTAPYAS